MKTQYGYISYEPIYLDGVLITDQRKLKEFHEERKRIEKLALEETERLIRELEAIQPTEEEQTQPQNNMQSKSIYEQMKENAPWMLNALSAESLEAIAKDHRKKTEDIEMSTEWGRLANEDPAELQRRMIEEPDRYEAMANTHALLMLAATGSKTGKRELDIDEHYLRNFLFSLKGWIAGQASGIQKRIAEAQEAKHATQAMSLMGMLEDFNKQQQNIEKVLDTDWKV